MGDKYYREKFDALGLSERFEFIGRDYSSYKGRKVIVRCRSCGADFKTWAFNEIKKGRASHLICSECGAASDGADAWTRSPQCDEAMAYYVQGHTVTETAVKFGVSKCQINNAVKVRRLTNGRDWRETSGESRERLRKEAEQRLIERLDALGFDYLGGYTNKTGKVTLKCRVCGDVFERTVDFVKRGNLICKKCEHEKALIRQAERREAQRQESVKKQARREAEREAERLAKSLEPSAYQLSRMALLDDVHVCKVCGKEYTLREYMQSTGSKYYRDSGYCSAECRHEAFRRSVRRSRKRRHVPENHRQRARANGCAYDASVTLPKLIKRKGLRCAICGEMCDPNDHTWGYSGPMYPSIDHIVPMSKGGGHVWGNVQVAHIICNSEKGDKIGKVV
jgi:5-methylcytosine-specific restriction endonuclease McrA